MNGEDWNRGEVEAAVSDYLRMLSAELAGVPYGKTEHRRQLMAKLNGRSEGSIEFKHANISAVLIDLGFPYISGYKPRGNYQSLLFDVVAERLNAEDRLLEIAAADADHPIVVPEVDDILSVLTNPPKPSGRPSSMKEPGAPHRRLRINYLEREARNSSLGLAGEQFALRFEQARLVSLGQERLASKVEHTSLVQGDGEGFDILSFEATGEPRFIEVKTTKYGQETPFFVSRNELEASQSRLDRYHLYRLFSFRASPGLFVLNGSLQKTCELAADSYVARVRPSIAGSPSAAS